MSLMKRILATAVISAALVGSARASELPKRLVNLLGTSAPVSFGVEGLRGTTIYSRNGKHFNGDAIGGGGNASAGLVGPISKSLAGGLEIEAGGKITKSTFADKVNMPNATNEGYFASGRLGFSNRGSRIIYVSGLAQYDRTRTEYFEGRNYSLFRLGPEFVIATKEGDKSAFINVSGGVLSNMLETGESGFYIQGGTGIDMNEWVGFELCGDYENLVGDVNRLQKTEAGADLVFRIPVDKIARVDLTAGVIYVSTATSFHNLPEKSPVALSNRHEGLYTVSQNPEDTERTHRTLAKFGAGISF